MIRDVLLFPSRFLNILERIARAMERESSADSPFTESMKRAEDMQARALEENRAWRAEEREHMAVCARRYEAMLRGEQHDLPVKH